MYILIGFSERTRLPFMYSSESNPGLVSNSLSVLKNLPSKCVKSLKKCTNKCQTLSLGSTFSCPQ